jgi:uncharacterized RDD family membrane protein YckC
VSTENPYAAPDSDVSVAETTELASRGARFGGAMIDALIGGLIVYPLMYVSGFLDKSMAGTVTTMEAIGFAIVSFLGFLALHGYLLAKHGQTIGKRLVKTRIVSVEDGAILPFGKVIALRYLPISIATQIPVVGVLLGFVDALFVFRNDRRCVHDLIAGTKVVNAS